LDGALSDSTIRRKLFDVVLKLRMKPDGSFELSSGKSISDLIAFARNMKNTEIMIRRG
jgi:hypothetical protein